MFITNMGLHIEPESRGCLKQYVIVPQPIFTVKPQTNVKISQCIHLTKKEYFFWCNVWAPTPI